MIHIFPSIRWLGTLQINIYDLIQQCIDVICATDSISSSLLFCPTLRMANNFLQSIQKFLRINEKQVVGTQLEKSSNRKAPELLAFVKTVKLELEKFAATGKSAIGDLEAFKGKSLLVAQVLCEFATTLLLGNPIDNRAFESEKIFVMLYSLPPNSHFGALMTKIFMGVLWHQVPHPPVSFQNQAGYQWRSADGSNNNLAFPNVGRAGEKYIQDCRSKRPLSSSLPDPGRIFDELLLRTPGKDGQFKANAFGISSNLLYMATLITHDVFDTDVTDRSINLSTSYLDLSPLYGTTKQIQDSVRTGVNGLLKPDRFADTRFWLQPDGLIALLVLFNRNHNYLAENLLKIDENRRFSSLNDVQRDEALFQTARLINERTYVNIVLHDYVRVILGVNRTDSSWSLNTLVDFTDVGTGGDVPSATGNQCSLEFNFLYRWHHATSVEDELWLEQIMTNLIGDWKNMDMRTMFQKLGEVKGDQKENLQLVRDEEGRIKDEDLARAMINGCNKVSGAFGGLNTPAFFRNIEISGILHARSMGTCTLNEFRSRLKLKKYESFEELNPELADRLAKLYPTVDDVELYPGLLSEEKEVPADGRGLCPNYTTAFAILSDAVALTRGDRFHMKEATYFNLTTFGMQDSESDPTIDHGTLIGRKLIARHLSSVFSPNSVYAIFPFTRPNETWKYLHEKRSNYDFNVPLQ